MTDHLRSSSMTLREQNMSDLVTLIAAEIERHMPASMSAGAGVQCSAGCIEEWEPAHVAGVVASRLNLHEERRTNAMSSAGMTVNSQTGEVKHHCDIRYDRRWVSEPWTTEEQQ